MHSANKKSYSNFNIMARAMADHGYAVDILPLSPKYVEFVAPNGWKWLTRWGALSYPFMSVACKQISMNKDLAYGFAAHHGITVPATLRIPEESDQIDEFLTKHAPVIVKPASSSASHGLTLNITTRDALEAAIAHAREYSEVVLVQKQLRGTEVRFTIVEGKLVSALQRQTAQVVGDGVTTVAELIARENEARKDLQFEYLPYPQLDASIISADLLHDQRVPVPDEIVVLSGSSMVSGGTSVYDVLADIHPSYKATAERLGRELNPELMVVDMMIEDFRAPQTDTNYAFIEFNTSPALRLYYGIRNGKPYDIVSQLVRMVDERSRQS